MQDAIWVPRGNFAPILASSRALQRDMQLRVLRLVSDPAVSSAAATQCHFGRHMQHSGVQKLPHCRPPQLQPLSLAR
eukprot:4580223-Amphidinium_carterae.1